MSVGRVIPAPSLLGPISLNGKTFYLKIKLILKAPYKVNREFSITREREMFTRLTLPRGLSYNIKSYDDFPAQVIRMQKQLMMSLAC